MEKNILLNLLDNSHDAQVSRKEDKNYNRNYHPETLIKAHVRDNIWHIEVADNGIGIPPERLERLFLPFSSTKASRISQKLWCYKF